MTFEEEFGGILKHVEEKPDHWRRVTAKNDFLHSELPGDF
jgi:hypothetical protein